MTTDSLLIGKTAPPSGGAGVFEGRSAIRDFLNPEKNPPLPLVELPPEVNKFANEGVRVFAKVMYLLPLLNIKSLPVLNMLLEAEQAGALDGVHTIVENSSGNTAFSLGVLARLFGIERVMALVPWDIAPGKLDMLRLCGVEPRLQKEAPGQAGGIGLAREMGQQNGHRNLAQYENDANPGAYERWVAPEIWRQTEGRITVFAAGLGTTGTLVGASRFFRRHNCRVTIVGSAVHPDSAVPGVRSIARLAEIQFDWRSATDCVVETTTKEAYKASLELCRAGLMAGPSSGFALAGLMRYLQLQKENASFDKLRNREGNVHAVFICCDTPLPYLDKYSTHLDPGDF